MTCSKVTAFVVPKLQVGELYVTAAAFSAGLFIGLALFGVGGWAAAVAAAAAGFLLRGADLARGWSLPAYQD